MNTYMKNITFTLMIFMSIPAAIYGAEVERKETAAQREQKEQLAQAQKLYARTVGILPQYLEEVAALASKTESEIDADAKLENEQTKAKNEIREIFYNKQNLPKKVVQTKAQKILDAGLLDEGELWHVLSNFVHFPNPTAIETLLKNGFDVNFVAYKSTLLIESIRFCKGNTDIVKLILERNPKREVLTSIGTSPLVTAFISDEGRSINDTEIEIVELLLSAGYTKIIYERKPYKNITDFITEYRALPEELLKTKISDEKAKQLIELFEKYTAKKTVVQKATEKKE